jgi:hypothetical protein
VSGTNDLSTLLEAPARNEIYSEVAIYIINTNSINDKAQNIFDEIRNVFSFRLNQ